MRPHLKSGSVSVWGGEAAPTGDPMKNHLFASAGLAALLSLSAPSLAQDAALGATLGEWGVETQHLSETVSPGEDFFQYVNEGWLEQAEIPAGRSVIGGFSMLRIEAEERVEAIINEFAASNGATGSIEQKVGDYYASIMNVNALNDNSMVAIQGELARINSIGSVDDMVELFPQTGHGGLFFPYVSFDDRDSTRYVLHMYQAGLGMPNRDYYLRDGEEEAGYRAAYLVHIQRILDLAGQRDAAAKAQAIMAFETQIAEIHWTRVQNRDPVARYHLVTREELDDYISGIDWQRYFDAYDVGDETEIVLTNDTSIQGLAALLQRTPLDTLRAYMTYQFLDNNASSISTALEDESFDFYSRTLNGIDENLPREQRAVRSVNGGLGELIGQAYVDRHFPPEHKAQMEELVEYLRRAMAEQITNAQWMDDETRAEALFKLENFHAKIGYPDRYRDYSSLEIRADDLFGNRVRLSQWAHEDSISRLGQPIREWQWGMTPQTVNAYYQSSTNQIVFPAAILQAPFFDPNADPAVNFGAIGGVIGHEMGHGFDDRGSQYDGHGVLRDWWSASSRTNYEARVARLVDQYAQFEPQEDLFLNGELTLGENIGDHSGSYTALRAYEMYLADHGGDAPVLDGFTGVQRFYMGWGQVWRRMRTADSMRARVLQGPHSPGIYRVNGTLQNHDDWYDAFGITEDDPLYVAPEDRAHLWD